MQTMKLSEELLWRGQIKDTTFRDITWLDNPRTFYLGADCSSSNSLTIGNLAIYMMARRLMEHGWKAVLLVGGATSLIGDPGGKESERELKSPEEIQANVQGISAQVKNLFAGASFELVNNYDWFKDIKYLDFLRDIGKHFSMTELVQREYIAERMGEGGAGISYAEFSYSLIQGYDYWYLHEHNPDLVLQIGGSDQWGNMLSGVPLIRKKSGDEVHAASIPLVIDKTTGRKFGKSEAGAIWLDPLKTSPYKFYQFWVNVDDDHVEDFLKIYTMLPKSDIESIIEEFEQNKSQRSAQKRLAYEVTKLVHGEERTESVVRVVSVLFGGTPPSELQLSDFDLLSQELPVVEVSSGETYVRALVDSSVAASTSEARRLLEQGAVYINGDPVNLTTTCDSSSILLEKYAVLRKGKNANVLLKIKQ